MTVVVDPATFQYVEFDAARIAAAASELLGRLDMGARDLRIEIDETSPISRVVLVATGPQLVVRAESGAFEDTRRPRALSVLAVATALGRVLLRSRDRAGGRFADAPADADLSLAQTAAWDAW